MRKKHKKTVSLTMPMSQMMHDDEEMRRRMGVPKKKRGKK